MSKRGNYTDFFGPMFATKTDALIAAAVREEIAGRYVSAFKHISDERRYGKGLRTHDKKRYPAISVENAIEIYQHLEKFVKKHKIQDLSRLAIIVDEVQFFTPEIIDFCAIMKHTSRVYTGHLDKNAFDEPFRFKNSERTVGELMALADSRVHLKAVCNYSETGSLFNCGEDATYTQRLDNHGKPVLSGEEVKVGGKEDYAPRCKRHYVPPTRDHAVFSIEGLLKGAANGMSSRKAKNKELALK